ncbi:MAG: YggS family pyridoxal phosphate-dependent enzyme [Anaerolineaceae bacterium]|nr:YggS family pyridoxal phosphate-dependent enzyme [Anaerolineaceae bacterium]
MDLQIRSIKSNLEKVREKVALAALKSGRRPEDVKIVVVSKGQPASILQAAVLAGAGILGENYPEEAVFKMIKMGKQEGVEWHMIGHLQSRKAKIIVENFDLMHSLDSLKLAEKLNRLCKEGGKRLPVLLEFNVGGEESKGGWEAANEEAWLQFLPDIENCLSLSNLDIRGLMTMPPWNENPERTRPYFVKLRKLQDFLKNAFPHNSFSELSMGTSVDFEVATQEGATYIRVGEAILGRRPPKTAN